MLIERDLGAGKQLRIDTDGRARRLQAETQNIDPLATILSLSFWTLLWGLAGAFLAVPLTLMSMMVFAQFDRTKRVAAMLSNDGRPDPVRKGQE